MAPVKERASPSGAPTTERGKISLSLIDLHDNAGDILIQWKLSIVATFGTQVAVLYREVSLIQRWICTQLYVVGTADSVLIREMPFIQSVLYREVSLYFMCVILAGAYLFLAMPFSHLPQPARRPQPSMSQRQLCG